MCCNPKIGLRTAVGLDSDSTALAADVVENKIQDKYPWLAPVAQREVPGTAFAVDAAVRRPMGPFTTEGKA